MIFFLGKVLSTSLQQNKVTLKSKFQMCGHVIARKLSVCNIKCKQAEKGLTMPVSVVMLRSSMKTYWITARDMGNTVSLCWGLQERDGFLTSHHFGAYHPVVMNV